MWYRHRSRHYSERPCNAAGAAFWRRLHQRWGWHAARRAFQLFLPGGLESLYLHPFNSSPLLRKVNWSEPGEMLTNHRCKAQERGIMTSSPALGILPGLTSPGAAFNH